MRYCIVIIVYFLVPVSILSAQSRVSSQLDTTDILIGDQFNLELLIELEKGSLLESVDYSGVENANGVEILERGPRDTIGEDNTTLILQRLVLTSFDSGYHKIPPIPVQYQENSQSKTLMTNELAFNVRVIPVSAETSELAPIKDIIEEPFNFQDLLPYLLILLGIVLIGAILYYFLTKRKTKVSATPEVIIPAHEIALKKLKDLQETKLWQRGLIKQFQTELTYIVREYLEKRYKIPALESTTEETLQMVRKLEDVDDHWINKLRDMFRVADLVKFAKAKPPADFHDQILIDAEHFVFETKEKPTDIEEVESS